MCDQASPRQGQLGLLEQPESLEQLESLEQPEKLEQLECPVVQAHPDHVSHAA